MSEYHFPVPGSIDEKKIVLFVRKHWVAYLGQFVLSVFLFFFPMVLILIVYLGDKRIFHDLVLNLLVLGGSTYYLIIASFIFTSWLSFYYDIYIITEDAIVDISQQGFFGRKISQLSLLRVQDVSSDIEGFLPTLFAYGNILVESAGEQTQNFILEQVPNPQEISAKIMELHNKIIETEGRHHQILEAEGALAPGKIDEDKPIESETWPISESAVQEPEKTKYQELLDKETHPAESQATPPPPSISMPPEQETKPIPPQEPNAEGEIRSDDLDKGGEVDFK